VDMMSQTLHLHWQMLFLVLMVPSFHPSTSDILENGSAESELNYFSWYISVVLIKPDVHDKLNVVVYFLCSLFCKFTVYTFD
jgi:hypothetical protein